MAEGWLKFFFEAMSGPNSYAGGGKAAPVDSMPGKGYVVEHGPYRLVDQYIVFSNGFSAGRTTQWVNDRLVLLMQYGGYYPKEVTAFLRKVLHTQYRLEDFRGFRGPTQFPAEPTDQDLHIYRNMPYNPPDWVDVCNTMPYALHINEYTQGAGQEVIVKNERGRYAIGWHDYHYMVFKPPK